MSKGLGQKTARYGLYSSSRVSLTAQPSLNFLEMEEETDICN